MGIMYKIIKKFNSLSENNKIILKNVLGAFTVKGLALVVSLFTMPAYMRYFNNEVALGLWFTLLSVLSWILNFDLGIGNGLRNKLTMTLATDDVAESKKYLSSAYISIGILCVILSVVFMFVSSFWNWNTVFNIEEGIVSQSAMLQTVRIVFVGIILQLLFKLITSVLYALQKSSVNNFLSLITSIITLICVLIIPSRNNDQNMICMAWVHVLAVILPLLVTTIILFSGKILRKCIPSLKCFSLMHTKAILALGGVFLFVQLAYMLIMSTNEYLIAFFCGNQYVTEYQIYYRLFSLGSTVFCLALTPVWSAVTKALAQQDIYWIKRLYRVLLKLSLVGSVAVFLLIPILQLLVDIWLGDNSISVNYLHAVAFAGLGSLMILNSALSSVANGLGKLKTQAICFCIGALIKVPLAWILVLLFESWIGVVWANIISMVIYCLIQPWVLNSNLNGIQLEG